MFQLTSVSKPLGSTVLAGLVGDRLVKWDDRIIDHDPGFQMHDPYATATLTIRDLYSHRSGLPDHAGDLLEDMGYDRAEVLRHLRVIPTKNNFRSHYAYTNFGLTEGAIAAANTAGKPWEEISEERLYKRSGMASISSRLSDFLARTNRARGHVWMDGRWVAKYQRKPDAQSPAGGASSSVNDMAQWMRLHLNGGTFNGQPIVSVEALAETYRPHMVTEPQPTKAAAERYGLYGVGWNVNYDELGRVRLGHSGAFSLGAATVVSLVPADRLGIVVLTNSQPLGYQSRWRKVSSIWRHTARCNMTGLPFIDRSLRRWRRRGAAPLTMPKRLLRDRRRWRMMSMSAPTRTSSTATSISSSRMAHSRCGRDPRNRRIR